MTVLKVIGLMSGSSLDGLDMAEVTFHQRDDGSLSHYRIHRTHTHPWEGDILDQLSRASTLSGSELMHLDRAMGHRISQILCARWGSALSDIDVIASHGHTVYHHPELRYTCQIGHGAAIAAGCGLPVITDLRSADVALGGSGAPMAPLADAHLFHQHEAFINLGGIANVSYPRDGTRIGIDVCPCNQWLNATATRASMTMDIDGRLAAAGTVQPALLKYLETLPYYHQPGRTSLDNHEVMHHLRDAPHSYTVEDTAATIVEHIAMRIALSMAAFHPTYSAEIMVTGGGAHNTYLLHRLEAHLPTSLSVHLPDSLIIDYKEALLIAYAGWCRWMGRPNFYAEWSGASRDSIGGALYWP